MMIEDQQERQCWKEKEEEEEEKEEEEEEEEEAEEEAEEEEEEEDDDDDDDVFHKVNIWTEAVFFITACSLLAITNIAKHMKTEVCTPSSKPPTGLYSIVAKNP
jgi:ABC-type Zn2+ transport system substrate-binding protein/surface adhesin